MLAPIPEGIYYCFTNKLAGIQPSESGEVYAGEIIPGEEKFLIKVFHRIKSDEQFSCPKERPDLGSFCRAKYFTKLPKKKTHDIVWKFKSDRYGIPSKYGNSLYSYDGKVFEHTLTTLWISKTHRKNKFRYRLSTINDYGGYIETGKCEVFSDE